MSRHCLKLTLLLGDALLGGGRCRRFEEGDLINGAETLLY